MRRSLFDLVWGCVFLEEAHAVRYPVIGVKAPACLVYLPELADDEMSEGLACWLSADNIDGVLKRCNPSVIGH